MSIRTRNEKRERKKKTKIAIEHTALNASRSARNERLDRTKRETSTFIIQKQYQHVWVFCFRVAFLSVCAPHYALASNLSFWCAHIQSICRSSHLIFSRSGLLRSIRISFENSNFVMSAHSFHTLHSRRACVCMHNNSNTNGNKRFSHKFTPKRLPTWRTGVCFAITTTSICKRNCCRKQRIDMAYDDMGWNYLFFTQNGRFFD